MPGNDNANELLRQAVQNGVDHFLPVAIQSGANVNARIYSSSENRGLSALRWAFDSNSDKVSSFPMVYLLLKWGAELEDETLKDWHKVVAIAIAIINVEAQTGSRPTPESFRQVSRRPELRQASQASLFCQSFLAEMKKRDNLDEVDEKNIQFAKDTSAMINRIAKGVDERQVSSCVIL